MSKKLYKTLSIVATSFIVLIMLFAIVITFMFYNAKQGKEVPSPFG